MPKTADRKRREKYAGYDKESLKKAILRPLEVVQSFRKAEHLSNPQIYTGKQNFRQIRSRQ
jgi:hypothetical protein